MAERAIGIDLGTSNSVVAVVSGQAVHVISNERGEAIHPSIVHLDAGGMVTVGTEAKRHLLVDRAHTLHSFKRLIGRYFFNDDVQRARALYGYELVEGPNRDVRIAAHGQALPVHQISAAVLREMKRLAEIALGQPIDQAVITVPANFNDNQRLATREAGQMAGLEVLKIINEPTAAALAYGYGQQKRERVAVYDLGGGTFDVSVLDIDRDVYAVRATAGDTFLGGDDFDARIVDFLADGFQAQTGIDLRDVPGALQALREASEIAKIELSEQESTTIEIDEISEDEEGPLTLAAELTRRQLRDMTQDLVQRTFKVCDEAMQIAGVRAGDLDGVVLVGGQTKSGFIRAAVESYFGQRAKADVDPDKVVAMGAAIHAHQLLHKTRDAVLIDVTPLSLRIGTVGGYTEIVIAKNTPIPVEQTQSFMTASDNQGSVRIRVYQGESREAESNTLLGEFEFSGFRIAARGEVSIEVTFDIDTSGIVNVLAIEKASGQQARGQVTLSAIRGADQT